MLIAQIVFAGTNSSQLPLSPESMTISDKLSFENTMLTPDIPSAIFDSLLSLRSQNTVPARETKKSVVRL